MTSHPILIDPLRAARGDLQAEQIAQRAALDAAVRRSLPTAALEQDLRDTSTKLSRVEQQLKAAIAEVKATPAPVQTVSDQTLNLGAALATAQRLRATAEDARATAFIALSLAPASNVARIAEEGASNRLQTLDRDLAGLASALTTSRAADARAVVDAQHAAHTARCDAATTAAYAVCVAVKAIDLEGLQLQLRELARLQNLAREAYTAAVIPLAGERFLRSPAMQLGLSSSVLLDDLAEVFVKHANDHHTPLDAARWHADKTADVLDAEIINFEKDNA